MSAAVREREDGRRRRVPPGEFDYSRLPDEDTSAITGEPS
jgi:hypothetical protein